MISRRVFLGAGAAATGLAALPSAPVFASGASVPWGQLANHLEGQLVLPSDAAYAVARQVECGQYDAVAPKAVAYCTSAADVAACVLFAQDNRLPATARSGGHSYGGYSTTTGLIIDLSRMNTVTVGGSTVDIGPGAQGVDIAATLHMHGLMVSEGGCPTVAAGGFIQGGGFGYLTRSVGMACDNLVSAQVVLASGRTVTASAAQNADLFWAIRGGGGGNFGIVTKFTVTPVVGDQMNMTNLIFPYDQVPDVLNGVAEWLADAPRTIGGGCYVAQTDASPGTVPATNVLLASHGTTAELQSEAARLLALTGQPTTRQDASLSYQDLEMLTFGCAGLTTEQCHRSGKSPSGVLSAPAYALERSRLGNAPLAQSDWADVMAAFDADRTPGQARYLDLHMFGGKANDPARTATAYVHRDALFSCNYRVFINDPADSTAANQAAAKSWVDHGFATIDPLTSGESYQNWIDPELTDWKESYYAENYARLVTVKSAYDPHRFFSFAQGIGS